MTQKNFVRENLVLVIGLALPILLIVLFFLASVLPKSMSAPPQYEMLFSVIHYDYQNNADSVACAECNDWRKHLNVDFVVRDGVLKARITKNEKKNQNYYSKRLMAYDGKSESVREIAFDISKLGDVADSTEVILDETKHMTINPSNTSPDGYVFDGPYYGGGGLVTEIFGGGHRNHGYRIKKGSIGYKLPSSQNDYYYNNIQFIGWVVGRK